MAAAVMTPLCARFGRPSLGPPSMARAFISPPIPLADQQLWQHYQARCSDQGKVFAVHLEPSEHVQPRLLSQREGYGPEPDCSIGTSRIASEIKDDIVRRPMPHDLETVPSSGTSIGNSDGQRLSDANWVWHEPDPHVARQSSSSTSCFRRTNSKAEN